MKLFPALTTCKKLLAKSAFTVIVLLFSFTTKAQCFEDYYVYQLYPYGQLCSPQYVTLRAEYDGTYYGEFRWYSSDTDPNPVQTTYVDQFNNTSDYSVYASTGTTVWVSFYNYYTGCESYRQAYTFYIPDPVGVYQDYAYKCNYDVAKVQVSSNTSGVTFELYKYNEYYDPNYGYYVQDYQLQQSNSTGYFEITDFDPAVDQYNYYVKAYQPYSCSSGYYYQLYFDLIGPDAPTVSGNLSVTSGSSTTVTASGNAYTFRWYDASGNQVNEGWQFATSSSLTPGTYTYSVRGSSSDGSCLTDATSFTITVEYPTVSYSSLYNSSNFSRSIDLSKPVGTTAGSVGTTPTGGATYTIPVYASPGTNSLQPSISVAYNSQAGDGVLGYGWNIAGLSQISRSGKTIFHNGSVSPVSYTNDDAFVLDGLRLLPLTGNNGGSGTVYAMEMEGFSKIVSNGGTVNNPDWFQVTGKDGTIMEFGRTADSKILTDDGLNVMLWRLNRIIDINSNYIDFSYNDQLRDSRIGSIKYTGNINGGLAPYNEIVFSYKGRADQNTVYLNGASMAQKTLLDNITVKAENNTVKRFQFNYGFDNIHSLLKEVIETGSDGSQLNSTIFRYGDQPVNFSVTNGVTFGTNVEFFSGDFNGDGKTDLVAANYYYKSNDPTRYHTKFDVKAFASFNAPTNLYTYYLPDNTAVKSDKKKIQSFLTSDYNKDGRDDILMANLTMGGAYGTFNKVNISYTTGDPSTGTSNSTSADFGVPYVSPYSYGTIHQKGNYFLPGDFDGDGNQDYILILGDARYAVLGASEFKAFLTSPATGEVNEEITNFGFGTNSNPAFYAATVAGADLVTSADLDGDGKTEILVTKDYQTYVLSVKRTSFASGYYFAASVLFYTSEITKDSKIFPGDFNGDGKTDWLVRNYGGSWKILYSTGVGFQSVPFAFNQTVTLNDDEFNPGDRIIIADFNGDGKSDILHGYWPDHSVFQSKLNLYYSRGDGTSFYYEQYDYNNVLNVYAVGDFNGDGRSDLINVSNFQTPIDLVEIKARGKDRLLSQVTNGHNFNTWIDYTNITDPSIYSRTVSFSDPVNVNPYNYIQMPLYAVSQISTPNEILGTNVTSYTYEDAVVHRAGRGFLGFKKVTAADQTGGITSVTENAINTQFAQPYMVKQTTKLTSNNEVLSESQLSNSFVDLGNNRFWQRADKLLDIDYLNGKATESTNTFDNYGNVTTNVSKVGTLSGTTVAPVETLTTVTAFSVHNTPVPAKPDQITMTKTRNGSASDNVTTQLYYSASGLVSSQVEFYGLPEAITTSYSYDGFGNPITTSVSAAGLSTRSTNVSFDTKGRFVLSKQLAPGTTIAQTESFTWDPKWGEPLSETSSDCLTKTYEYDGFGRNKKVMGPVFTLNSSLVWDVQAGNLYYSLEHYSGGRPDVKTWFDAWGRPRIKQVMGFNGQWLTSNNIFDAKGNLSSTTNLHYSSETAQQTTNTYDSYNRLQTVATPVNTMTYAYNKLSGGNFQVVATDQSGQTSSKTTDAAGRIVSSNDKGGDLNFTYDSRGLQTEVKHGSTTLITTTYDPYGRQASMQDVNAGTVTYVYDAFGQLTQQTDNSSHSYQMTYDVLGRITSRHGAEGTTTYDYYKDNSGCSNNSVSKITGFNNISKEYTYDNLKRVQSEKVTIDGTAYTTQYGYDLWSNVNKTTYPSGVEVNNSYDNNGYLNQVTGGNPGAQTTLFNALQMNGSGQVTSYSLGNGKTSQVTYQNGFPTRFYTQGVQDLNFTWDFAHGNLSTRQDALKSLNESFQYDGVNRLTQVSVNGQIQQNIGYDGNSNFSMGNIASKTDASLNYKYKDDKIHAVAYLTNPNAISQSTIGQTISYTPFLKVATITEDSYGMTFTYWPDYQRIETQATSNDVVTETKYFLDNYEKQTDNSGAREIHYVSAGNGLCAIIVKQNGVNNFYIPYSDHLGSLLTITDLSGNIVAQQNFDAWGRKRNPDDWTYNNIPSVPVWLYRGFTGHEHLTQFSLVNMNGRMYDPIQGRMLSPDNYIPEPWNTQGYNRYAYARNNPLSYVDPDGNFWFVPIIIGAVIGGFAGGVQADMNGQNFWSGAWKGAVVGAVGGGLSIIGTPGSLIGNMAWGAGQGVATNGVNNLLNGQNFFSGVGLAAGIGAGFGLLTSDNTSNFFRGRGFKSNSKVLQDFVDEGDYEGALNYFHMNAVFDENATSGDSYFRGRFDVSDKKIHLSKYAFQVREGSDASFDLLNSTYTKELWHQSRWAAGKLFVDVGDNWPAPFPGALRAEDALGFAYQQKNAGVWPGLYKVNPNASYLGWANNMQHASDFARQHFFSSYHNMWFKPGFNEFLNSLPRRFRFILPFNP